MDTKLTEKEEKYIRKFSALVTSSKASIYVCPLIVKNRLIFPLNFHFFLVFQEGFVGETQFLFQIS